MWIDWLQDLRRGLHQILYRPGFAAIAIASLALGIGANTILFCALNSLLLQPIPGVAESARLVELGRGSQEGGFDSFAAPDLQDIAAGVPSLDHVFAFHIAPLNVRAGGDPRRALGFVVSESYFETLGVSAALGRTFVSADAGKMEATPGVVISEAAWRSHFNADPAVLGRTLVINGASFSVIGVAPAEFRGHVAAMQPEFFVPLSLAPLINANARDMITQRNARWLLAGARLAPGASAEQAQVELDGIAQRLAKAYPESHSNIRFNLAPMASLPAGARQVVGLFAGVMFALVGMILVLACVNVAGMLLARGESRSGEMAVRTALGASRGRLVRQLLAEGLVLAALAGAAGIALAYWGRALLLAIPIPAPFPIQPSLPLDGRVLGFAVVTSLVTAVLFAAWPALRVSQRHPRQALNAGGATGMHQRARSREVLVVAQIAVSLVLLVAAALFLRSLGRAADIDPGFQAQGVAYADFDLEPAGYSDERTLAVSDALLTRVRALPGVESASLAGVLPLSLSRMSFGLARDPTQPEQLLGPDVNTVSPEYFRTLDIALRGRDFAASDKRGSDDVAIVNQTLATQLFGEQDPIGRSFELGDDADWRRLRVIGVATDGKYASLSEERTGFIFLPSAQWLRSSQNLLVKSAMPPAALERVLRAELATVDANLPALSVHSLEDVTAISVLPQRIAGYVTSVLGVVGMLLAATGLYGVMAFYVAQRRREIGVRLALGASRETIVRTVASRAARLTVIGLAVGLALAAAASQALQSLLFGISASDVWAFVGAASVLTLAVAMATFGPAWRAASVHPSQALRYE